MAVFSVTGRGTRSVRPTVVHLANTSITDGMIACGEFSRCTPYDHINNTLNYTTTSNNVLFEALTRQGETRRVIRAAANSAWAAVYTATPSTMQVNPPLTMAWWGWQTAGSGTSGQRYAGISWNDTALAVGVGNENTIRSNNNGSATSFASNYFFSRAAPANDRGFTLSVLTIDSAGLGRTYLNGVFQTSGSLCASGVIVYGSPTTYAIAGAPYTGPWGYVQYVSDFWMWNRQLSQGEIISLYEPNSRWRIYTGPSGGITYLDLGVTPVTRAPGLGAVTLAGAAGSAFRLQYARPATDVSADGWKPITGASLAAMIDESGTPTP